MTPTAASPYPTDTLGLRTNRACRNCVQIKAKCVPVPGSNSSTCQRCHRLDKVCTTPAPVPRHRGRNKSNRVAQLEERINNLTSLLTSTKPADEVPNQPSSHAQQSMLTPPVSIIHDPDQPSCQSSSHAKSACRPPPGNSASNDADKTTHFRTRLPPAIEERLFSDFRTYMNGYFPYVIIPPQVSSASVREEKPFLFRTCIAVACHVDPPVQRQLGEELFRHIGESMLLKAEKSLDLLQGILVLISWYQCYNFYNPQWMNLLHLASALAIDLGINRPNHSGPWPPVGMVVDTNQLIHGKSVNHGCKTSDERRALLGVYYLTAELAACFRRVDSMQWTHHLEDCCNALLAADEYASDIEAVQMVRLHRMVGRYHDGSVPLENVPISTYSRCVQDDFQRFRKDLPAGLEGSTRFELHVLSHEISSLEHIMSSGVDTALARAGALYTCLKRVGNLIDCFTKFPATRLQYIPFMIWIHLLHAIIVIAKLSFLEAEGWDLQYVRTSETSFPATCTGLIAYLEAASRQCQGESQVPSPVSARFNMSAEKLRQCLKWYENKIQAEAESMASTEPCVVRNLPPFDPALEGFFEGFDDGLWADFTGDFGNTGMQF
ncbi:hypothetical protein EDD37DRAFT_290559 [Exophiala viscosa]|uniref:uncharacterized protein n=1 Tax=Exophiala viscosa TaxID=2486360 RepID=UPI0021924BA0|nr:hypothetical protein EDD37DRAFT_290559 [Exophiala viscosa]